MATLALRISLSAGIHKTNFKLKIVVSADLPEFFVKPSEACFFVENRNDGRAKHGDLRC